MSVDFKRIKSKVKEKLPGMLPKAIKWAIIHLLMLLYHFRMPIWVTVFKALKTAWNFKSSKHASASEKTL